jgi:hypothetical protein
MDTGAERRLSRGAHGRSLEVENPASLPPLAELALALPWKMVHATRAFLRPAATRPGRDCINMPRMSGDWLIQYEEACAKQGDTL